jgi:hypothetical protein
MTSKTVPQAEHFSRPVPGEGFDRPHPGHEIIGGMRNAVVHWEHLYTPGPGEGRSRPHPGQRAMIVGTTNSV